jgi:hypothetical protein
MTHLQVVQPYRRLMPQEPQTFAAEADRARLSRAGIAGFRSVAAAWSLSNVEAAALMAVSVSTWERMRKPAWQGSLNQDQLTRVSAIVGILKGLRLLFSDGLADEWPRLKNAGSLFDGATPVESMIEGGIPRMLDVRRHVDALRGGL